MTPRTSRAARALAFTALLTVPGTLAAVGYYRSLFEARLSQPTGEHPLDVALGDVDQDGHLDILTANREGRSVSIFLGNNHGGISEDRPLETGFGCTSLALGDMDADGILDVVASQCEEGCVDNRIGIYYGSGDGTFGKSRSFLAAGVPYNVTLADFNGDERLDVAASDYPGNRIRLLLSGPDPEVYSWSELETGKHPIALLSADLDRNGIPDLITSDHADGASSVYLGQGDGQFYGRIVVPTDQLPYSIALAPMDPDPTLDLVVAHSGTPGRVSVLRGQGDGTFVHLDQLDVDDSLVFVDTADFNGDGRPDVIVTRHEKSYATVFLNLGQGKLDPRGIDLDAENRIYSLAVGRLNADPFPDLVTVDYEKNTISVALGKALDPPIGTPPRPEARHIGFATIARGVESSVRGLRREVFRTPGAWSRFWEEHRAHREGRREPPVLDFEREMALCVFSGTPEQLGREVSFRRIRQEGARWVVEYVEREASPRTSAPPRTFNPFHIVKTVRFDGDVEFEESR